MRWLAFAICFLPALCAQPTLAPGYRATTFHTTVPGQNLTSVAIDAQDRVFAATGSGLIARLEDADGDGHAETIVPFWVGAGIQPPLLGLLWFQGSLYVSHRATISVIPDANGDGFGDGITDLVTGLPFGWHQNNQLFTDGARLYFGLGSTTDHDPESDPRSATLLSMAPDGTDVRIEARGLRNLYDGVHRPDLGVVLAGDNGPNLFPGTPSPRDEINAIAPLSDHGHPADWGALPAPGPSAPLQALPPHVAPTGIALLPSTRASGVADEAWLATWTPGTGNLLRVRVHRRAQGELYAESETFASGLQGAIDLSFDGAGRLFVVEYLAGRILRITQEHPATLRCDTPLRLGQRMGIECAAPDFPGHDAWLAASVLAPAPLTLAPGLFVHLDLAHPLFLLSLTPGQGIFDFPVPVQLDASGTGHAAIDVPAWPALLGFEIALQYSVWTPGPNSSPRSASPPIALRVVPD